MTKAFRPIPRQKRHPAAVSATIMILMAAAIMLFHGALCLAVRVPFIARVSMVTALRATLPSSARVNILSFSEGFNESADRVYRLNTEVTLIDGEKSRIGITAPRKRPGAIVFD